MSRCPRHLVLVVMALIWLVLPACSDKTKPKPQEQQAEESLAAMTINDETPNVLYTYMDDQGQFITVEKAADVPELFRSDVIVVNLNLAPEARQSTDKVVVADLTDKSEGHFKIRVEPRAQFENSLKQLRQWKVSRTRKAMPDTGIRPHNLGQQKPLPKSDTVVLYGTSWCGYCARTRDFLRKNKVEFVEKDIEKDDQAALEMQTKCDMAQAPCNGVPVVDWKGVLIPGFHEEQYKRMLTDPPPPPQPVLIPRKKHDVIPNDEL